MKPLKTILALTLAGGLLMGVAFPAQADTGITSPQPHLQLKQEGGGKWHRAFGKVEVFRGVVEEAVTDETSNRIVLASGEETVEIILDEATKIRVPTLGKTAGLEDIQIGMQVVALAYRTEDEDTLIARHLVVIPETPQFRHRVGQVLEYTEGVSIIIQPRKGDPVEFEIVDDLKVLPPGASVVDAWVTVISRRDPANDRLTAQGVVVHPVNPVLARLRLLNHLQNNLLNYLEWHEYEYISGIITVAEAEELITIDSTELSYDDSTVFVLQGVLSVQGQSGIIFYKDGLAKAVLVGVEPLEME